jgi:hypothetical protein
MKKIRFILPAIVLLVSLLTVSAQAAELIINGSFETPVIGSGTWSTYTSITGWTSTNSIEVRNNVAGSAFDGNNYVELDVYSNSSISQTVITNVGTNYTLTYYYAARPNSKGASSNGISLYINGVDKGTVGQNTNTNWAGISVGFLGTGSDKIEFRAEGTSDSYGTSLDNVSLRAVPVPAAIWLLGSGLFGLIGMKRKFRV